MTSSTTATAVVDFGSTFTKVRAVAADGRLLGAVQHLTTVDTDVFDGLGLALDELRRTVQGIEIDHVVACSSAGGGLRLAVVGLVDDLTAEAARQAALSAGGRVITAVGGGLQDLAAARALLAGAPDIVVLVGGTDGGDAQSLVRSARALAEARADVPVVVAGNVDCQPEAARLLRGAGIHVECAPNVMPQIKTLAPDGVRAVLRELFISHVIGGKLAGSTGRLEELVRMATPDAVLQGVELLARMLHEAGEVGGAIVIDVGGATTDVHSSSVAPVGETSGLGRALLPQTASARTVEADLGMRWNAPGIVDAGVREGVLSEDEAAALRPAADLLAQDPSSLPSAADEHAVDRMLARTAIAVALRRHAGQRRITLTPDGAVLEREGRDLTAVPLILGTGGVFRGLEPIDLEQGLALAHRGREDRLLPQAVRGDIDRRYVLAAAGVLAADDEQAARRLLAAELAVFPTTEKERYVSA